MRSFSVGFFFFWVAFAGGSSVALARATAFSGAPDAVSVVARDSVLLAALSDAAAADSLPQPRLHIRENPRVVAAVLAVTLGMLGVHRLYLGTKPWVPLAYLLTFGGGFFVLPLIDLVAILTTRDLDAFRNNPGIFMWLKNREEPEVPLP